MQPKLKIDSTICRYSSDDDKYIEITSIFTNGKRKTSKFKCGYLKHQADCNKESKIKFDLFKFDMLWPCLTAKDFHDIRHDAGLFIVGYNRFDILEEYPNLFGRIVYEI